MLSFLHVYRQNYIILDLKNPYVINRCIAVVFFKSGNFVCFNDRSFYLKSLKIRISRLENLKCIFKKNYEIIQTFVGVYVSNQFFFLVFFFFCRIIKCVFRDVYEISVVNGITNFCVLVFTEFSNCFYSFISHVSLRRSEKSASAFHKCYNEVSKRKRKKQNPYFCPPPPNTVEVKSFITLRKPFIGLVSINRLACTCEKKRVKCTSKRSRRSRVLCVNRK